MPRSNLYRNIAYTFLGLTVLVVISVLWLSSVHATVAVHVKQEAVNLDGAVEIARQPQSGKIGGRVMQSVFTQTQDFSIPISTSTTDTQVTSSPAAAPVAVPTPSSSDTNAPLLSDTVIARGTVRIVNNSAHAQTLVKTTRLLTADQKLYRIDRQVHILPGQEVSVEVHADKAGQVYAIGPSRFTIPGLFIDLQKYIYAVSDVAFTATAPSGAFRDGTATPPLAAAPTTTLPLVVPTTHLMGVPVVTQAIVNQDEQTLTQQVIDQARSVLASEVNDPKLDHVVVFAQPVDPPRSSAQPGEVTDHIRITIKLSVTAVFYPEQDMLSLVRDQLKNKIPDGREFLPLRAQDVKENLEAADPHAETATIHVVAQGTYQLATSSPSLDKSLVEGKTVDQALNILRSVPGVEDVQIHLSPGWIGKIPTVTDHIDIQVQ